MLQPLNKECSREVRMSTTHWFLRYQRVRFLTTIKRYVILMVCQWKLAKMQDWKLVWKPLYSQSILHGNRHPICWETKWYYKYTRCDKINMISCRLQSTNIISFQKNYRPTETKTIWDTIGTANKTHKTDLVIKHKWHEYVILPHPYTTRPYLWLHWGVLNVYDSNDSM